MTIDASLPADPVTRRKAPVTAHPWFAAFLALWFAALLGLSSLVLGPAMLERIVAASRIETFVAAAAPPLGQTARLLTALGLAGLGGLFGLILGRVLGRPVRHAAPVAPADHVRENSELAEPAPGLRDRLARLTGQGEGPRDFDDLPMLRAHDRHADAPGREPLPADDAVVAEVMAVEAQAEQLAPAVEPMDPTTLEIPQGPAAEPALIDSEPLELETLLADEPDEPAEPAAPAPTPVAAPAPVPAAVAALLAAPLDSLGIVQLTERLAISMSERRERDATRAQAGRTANGAAGEPPVALPSPAARHPLHPAVAPCALPEIGSEALRTGYSSLVGLTRKPDVRDPLRLAPDSVEPVVRPGPFAAPASAVHPDDNKGMAEGTRAQNYRALKDALASLQQISGTR